MFIGRLQSPRQAFEHVRSHCLLSIVSNTYKTLRVPMVACHALCAPRSSSRQLSLYFKHMQSYPLCKLKIQPLPVLGSPAGCCGLQRGLLISVCLAVSSISFLRHCADITQTDFILQSAFCETLAPLADGSRCLNNNCNPFHSLHILSKNQKNYFQYPNQSRVVRNESIPFF